MIRSDDTAQETHDYLQQQRANQAQATGRGPVFEARGISLAPLGATRARMVELWGTEIDERGIA